MAGALLYNVIKKILWNQCERHRTRRSLGQNVVKIVDMDSSRFHRVQQPRPSKLLNLKMRLRVAHLRPRDWSLFQKLHRLSVNPNNDNNLGNLLSLKKQPLRLEQMRFGHSFGTAEKQER
jgi:hypothetical protein